MKKFLAIFLAVLPLMAACTAESVPSPRKAQGPVFTASIEGVTPDAKTVLADGFKVRWVDNDAVSVFDGTNHAKYITANGGSTASFSIAEDSPESIGQAAEYYAIYPYNADDSFIGNVFSTTIPNLQYGVKDGFDNKAVLMVAKSTNTTFVMKNLVALLKITIPDNVTSVMIGNLDGVPMAGDVSFTLKQDGTPDNIVATAENILLIPTCDNTTTSDQTFEAGDYYVAVAPGSITGGFTICMSKKDEESLWIANGTNSCTVKRSYVMNLGDLDAVTAEVPMIVVRLPFSDGTGEAFTNAFSSPASFSSSEATANYIGENIFYAKDDYDSFQYSSYGKNGYTQNKAGGFRMARDPGDYLELPAINGCTLVAARVWIGGGGLILHGLTDTLGVHVNGGSAYRRVINIGDNLWFHNIGSQAGTHYRITAQPKNTRWLAMRKGEFYYSGAPTTTVACVHTLAPQMGGTSPTLKGSMTMFYGDFSDATCGFEYRTASGTEWTKLTCDEADETFSKSVALPVGDYVYRAWAKAGKVTLYGEEKAVSSFTGLTLDIVMGGEIANTTGEVLYQSASMFPTNAYATKDGTRNDKQIVTNDLKTGYTFRFWATYGIARSTSSNKIQGMRYNPMSSGNYGGNDGRGWMQFPAVEGFKLKSVSWTTKATSTRYKWSIVSAIEEQESTTFPWKIATGAVTMGTMDFTSLTTQSVTLSNPVAGVGYYAILTCNSYNVDLQEIHLVYSQD